jgi:hypothetical protein
MKSDRKKRGKSLDRRKEGKGKSTGKKRVPAQKAELRPSRGREICAAVSATVAQRSYTSPPAATTFHRKTQ